MAKKYTIEIINPITGKGLGREYKANSEVENEANYIEIGAIIRDENNIVMDNVVVSVETSDPTQNKAMTGTGNIVTIKTKTKKIRIPYYHLHYEFRQSGNHKITFEVGNSKEHVNIKVD